MAEEAIEALENRREENGKALQEAFRIFRALKGKPPTLAEFMSFFTAGEKAVFDRLAIKTWLETNKPNISLVPGREHLAVPLPADAADLWDALEAVRPRTADPTRYWNEEAGRFFGLPVDDDEAEAIRARYIRHARSEEHLAVLRLLESMARLINFANQAKGADVTPAKLALSSPWLASMLTAKKVPHPRYNTTIYHFAPDEDFFCGPREKYKAFDEG